MHKKSFFIFLSSILMLGYYTAALPAPIDPIKKNDRILILAPHPDDETIGCAGIIQQALSAGAKVQVAYLTNGDHNQFAFIVYEKRLTFRKGEFIHMGEVRRSEAVKAMKTLGLDEDNLIFLGYPDFGTFTIFNQYWQAYKKPFRDRMTRISSVPYKNNLSYDAPYTGESILDDLKNVLLNYKPNKIFVSHPADVNVDHKTLYLFLQVALRDLNKEIPKPRVYPYLVHCLGWPAPRHYHPELNLEPPEKFAGSQINWEESALTPEQLDKKHKAILCYKSQTESSAFYLLSFVRKNELFGDYPEIKIKGAVFEEKKAVSPFGFLGMFRKQDSGGPGNLEGPPKSNDRVSYAVVDNSIVIRIEKTKEARRQINLMLYLFGYSYKTPFAHMPKIKIIAKYGKFRVFNGKTMINPQGISLEVGPNALILKVPLQILGFPDFILTSVKSYRKALPIGVSGFRKVYIE
ncbi:MAG: PIG-L deacetylase family protein [Candidatus Omnitrophota bacterium]